MAIQNYSDHIVLVELPSEPQIRQELDNVEKIIQQKTDCDVLVDLSNVDTMTSSSISGFLQLYKLLTNSGRKLVLCNASSVTKDIFGLTCFHGIFEFIDDKSEALVSLEAARESEPAN